MRTINLADFGFKSLETTGSILEGSNQLHVGSSSGFHIGDTVIVGVGGESGGGMRGTTGVGGVWDTSQSPYASPSSYYFGDAAPKALTAKIMGISDDGSVLILDQPAAASANAASVFFDNKPAWDAAVASTTADNVMVEIPAGDFALSGQLRLAQRTGWTIEGAGKDQTRLFSVDGANASSISVFQSDDTTLKNFELHGNARLQGYGFGPPEEGWVPGGICFTLCNGGTAEDITVRDVFMMAVGSSMSTNVWAHRVDAHLTDGLAGYMQWQFQWSDSTGGGAVDCSVDSPTLVAGFETFNSSGTSFIRPTTTNAVMAANSSGGYIIEDATIVITEGSHVNDTWFNKNNPVININSNLNANNPLGLEGGQIINVEIRQDGYINASKDILSGIAIGSNNPNVSVLGGIYIAPDYTSGNAGSGPIGLWSHGASTLVDGFGVIGLGPNPNIIVDTGTIQNSFAHSIWVKSGQAIANGSSQALTIAGTGVSTLVDGRGTFTFVVSRYGDVSQALTAAYEVAGSGNDPAAVQASRGNAEPTGTVSFAAGETTKTITVLMAGPAARGPDQQFTVTLRTSTPGAYVLGGVAEGAIPGDAPPNGEALIIGRAQVDEFLRVDASGVSDADGVGFLHYQWQSSSDNFTWSNVGSDAATYRLTAADQGTVVRAVVTYVDGKGLLEAVTSGITSMITSGFPTPPDETPPSSNDAIPAISSNGGGASAAVSVTENTAAVTTVRATDADGTVPTYSIVGGADAAKFIINANSGALSFRSAPDYETAADADQNNIYDVVVRASDGTRFDDQELAVAITNVNDAAPVISSNGGGSSAIVSVAENTTVVTTVRASDSDGAGPTYAIAGGADAAKFIINANSGALSFRSAPDYEMAADSDQNNIYDVVVRASDGTRFDDQALAVAITNVNDAAPVNSSNQGGAISAEPEAEHHGGRTFNGDAFGDVLWQHASGQAAVWTTNGSAVTGGAFAGGSPGPSWQLVAPGDFSGDGRPDFLWQNDSGQAAIWTMDGTSLVAGSLLGANPGPSWLLRDAGDFDGDGVADVLWQQTNGEVAVWLTNNGQFESGAVAGANPGPTWNVKAAADFDGDGKSDILWQNDDGTAAVWLMDGTTQIGGAVVGASNGASWHVIDTADFDGDGKADILWQNDSGQAAIWLMDGTQLVAGALASSNPGPAWHAKGAQDFNADGRADILWQQDDGTAAIWTVDGVNVTGGALLGNPGADWHVV